MYVGEEPPPGEGWVQEEDVLDTWFSSWLWPFSTLGWPEETADLSAFYPTSTLVTGPDIIFFWVARMIMAGLEFRGEIPFSQVYFTGIIRDTEGRKMSKSLGNSPDPLDVIEEYGADALRFTIARLSPIGQDVYYSNKLCELGRNFANKIWNASRFVTSTIGDEAVSDPAAAAADLAPDERAILSRLERTVEEVGSHLERFHFNDAALAIYDFFWHHFCDRYLEASKHSLSAGSGPEAALVRGTLHRVLERVLALLHPIMPFITEEIWGRIGRDGLLMDSPWPRPARVLLDPAAEAAAEVKFEVLAALRNLRVEYNVPPKQGVVFYLVSEDPGRHELLASQADSLAALLRQDRVVVDPAWKAESPTPSVLVAGCRAYMPLDGIVDIEQERERFSRQKTKLQAELASVESRLHNPNFLDRAPDEVKQSTRERVARIREKISRVEAALAGLG